MSMQKLIEAASQGLDLSPADPVAKWAVERIREQELDYANVCYNLQQAQERNREFSALLTKSIGGIAAERIRTLEAELAERCGPSHPYKDGCFCTPCVTVRNFDRIRALEAALTVESRRLDWLMQRSNGIPEVYAITNGRHINWSRDALDDMLALTPETTAKRPSSTEGHVFNDVPHVWRAVRDCQCESCRTYYELNRDSSKEKDIR
jgi:hypothetical protein